MIRTVSAAFILSLLASAMALSFASLIYTGELAVHLGWGIGLMLIGGSILPVICAFLCSYRGTIANVQDVPAIFLSLPAATIAASVAVPDEAFVTVAALIGVTSIASGVVLLAAGVFRLGYVVRFIPYSVIGGFLASTGYLLIMGGLTMIAKETVSLWSLDVLWQSGMPQRWLPWVAAAFVIVVMTRLIPHDLVLPGCLIGFCALFYAVLWWSGISLGQAEEMGLLLGPFEGENFLVGLSPGMIADVHWWLILAETPTILAVCAMALVGLLLNVTGAELALNQKLDPERDLKAVGCANIVAGTFGGFTGYHALSQIVFAQRLGLTGVIAGISVASGSVFLLFFGTGLVAMLPVGLMACIVMYVGLDFLVDWIWRQRQSLPWGDIAIFLLILLVTATIGVLEALSVGLLLAALLFIISYSGLEVVRARTTLATHRSSVERSEQASVALRSLGQGTVIYELMGYLFFGTARGLAERITGDVQRGGLERLLIDFRRTSGMDASAAFALSQLAETTGVPVTFTGMTEADQAKLPTEARSVIHFEADLGAALTAIEADLLSNLEEEDAQDFISTFRANHPGVDVAKFYTETGLKAEQVLFEQGSQSATLYQVLEGELRAEIRGPNGQPITVAQFLPGAMIGEIAYYSGGLRTASIIANSKARLACFEPPKSAKNEDELLLSYALGQHVASHMARRLARMTKLMVEAGM